MKHHGHLGVLLSAHGGPPHGVTPMLQEKCFAQSPGSNTSRMESPSEDVAPNGPLCLGPGVPAENSEAVVQDDLQGELSLRH
jgi:hypothetical protein